MEYISEFLREVSALLGECRFEEALARLCPANIAHEMERAQAYFLQAKAQRNLSRLPEALEAYSHAARLFNLCSQLEYSADARSGIALCHWQLGDLEMATREQLIALDLYEDIGDHTGRANALNTLGLIAWRRKVHDEAIRYFQQSLDAYEHLSHAQGLAATVNNLGGVYEELEKFETAKEFYTQAHVLYGRAGDDAGLALSAGNLSWILAELGELAEAARWSAWALEAYTDLGDKGGQARSILQAANIHIKQGDTKGSNRLLYRAAIMAHRVKDREIERTALQDLVSGLRKSGRKSALAARYDRLLSLERETFSKAREETILDLQARYRERERVSEMDALARERGLSVALLAVVSHDFRRHLSGILDELEPLGLSSLRDRVRRVNAALEEYLAWARSKLEGSSVDAAPVTLRELVQECLQLHAPRFNARGLVLDLSWRDSEEPFRGDRAMLKIIVNNLLGNASLHAEQSSLVCIQTGRVEPGTDFIVVSNEAGRKAAREDSGFGIPMCSWLAQQAGWTFQLQEDGTRFSARIELPGGAVA